MATRDDKSWRSPPSMFIFKRSCVNFFFQGFVITNLYLPPVLIRKYDT
ncbi:hypothetical protein RintRC_1398 [Richelia intracellularis]|nr:hypothetical protein RintRC_1398 [Richelia intracellularis]